MSAHLLLIKWNLTSALIGICLLAAGAFSAPQTHNSFNNNRYHHHASAASFAGAPGLSTAAAATATSGFAEPNWTPVNNRRQLHEPNSTESLLGQLLKLESKPAESLKECANWFNLNQSYSRLVGGHQERSGAAQKRNECDELRTRGETASRLNAFKRKLRTESGHVSAIEELASDYLKLNEDFATNRQLAREFDSLKGADEHFQAMLERLEDFLQSIASTLGSGSKNGQEGPNVLVASTAAAKGDELNELDATLRQLVDLEGRLGDDELDQMAELAGILERILADGNVELNSGKFRYLSGTLDAVRTVLLHELADAKSEQGLFKTIQGDVGLGESFPVHPHVDAATATASATSSSANAFGGGRLASPSFSSDFVGQNQFPSNIFYSAHKL